MADLDKTIKGIEHCLARYVDGLCDDCPYMGAIDQSYMIPMKCKEIIMRDALELLKILDSVLKFLAECGLDLPCDELPSDDGWCDEHCSLNGQTKDCWLRYFSKY